MKRKLLVAVDYDDTFSADPDAFREIIAVLRGYGHECIVVTARAPHWNADLEEATADLGLQIVYCEGNSKREVTEALGLKVSIWIDDSPEMIVRTSEETPRLILRERHG